MPRTQREQAAFQKSVWDLALQVMNRCQMGQLKSQKLNRKHLISTPEFKQHLLQLLHHLHPQFQQSILQKIVDQEVSLSEMKKEASEFRSMCVISLLSCDSQVVIPGMKQRKFPAFTSAERLSQYTSLDYKHAVPEVFHTFCQAALDSTATGSLSSSPMTRIDVNGVSVYLIEANFSSISAQSLQRADTSYSCAHLMICNMPEVRKRGGEVDKLFNFLAHYYNNVFSVLSMQECSLADAEEMAYTSRQLNSLSTGVQCFKVVFVVSHSNILSKRELRSVLTVLK